MKNVLLIIGLSLFTLMSCKKEPVVPATPPVAVVTNDFNKSYTTTTTYWGTPYVSSVTISGTTTKTLDIIQTIDGDIDTITLTGQYNETAKTIAIDPCSSCGVGQREVYADGYVKFKNDKLYILWHENGGMVGNSPLILTWEINEN